MIAALTKWKLTVYLTAIFAAGGVSGWLVAAKTAKQTEVQKAVAQAVAPVEKDEIAGWMRRSCVDKLNLSPDQKEKANLVLDKYAGDLKKMQDTHMGTVRDVLNKRDTELKGLLTESQKQEFEKLERERKEAKRERSASQSRGDKNDHEKGDRGDRPRRDRAKSNNASDASITNDCPVTNHTGLLSPEPKAKPAPANPTDQ